MMSSLVKVWGTTLVSLVVLSDAAATIGSGLGLGLSPTQVAISLTMDAQDLPSGRFEFVPSDDFGVSHRFGDVTMRVRAASAAAGSAYTTLTTAGAKTITELDPLPSGDIAAATIPLSPSNAGGVAPQLHLNRHWSRIDELNGELKFELFNNKSGEAVEVGGWGAAMSFQGMPVSGANKTLPGLAATCAMVDPSISGNHGFVSVTRMTGVGQVLLVVPTKLTSFEAYRTMTEARGGGFYEMTGLSKAYAENEWVNSSAKQWLEPTSVIIQPGESHVFSYRFFLADSIRAKDAALEAAGFSVMQAVPSYSIATDMNSAKLHLIPPRDGKTDKYAEILNITSYPESAIVASVPLPGTRMDGGVYYSVSVKGVTTGRVRLTVFYTDGSMHVASYFVMPPLNEHVTKYGDFLAKVAWYDNVTDPFSRGHSVLAWNRQLKKHIGVGPWDNGYEDNRIFNNGLQDEAGAGANVGFAAVVGGIANPYQAAKLDLYINDTLYGIKEGLPFGASLQCVEGQEGLESPSCGPPSEVGPTADGIMASMFWVPDTPDKPRMPGYDYDSRWFCTPPDCPHGWPGWRWDQARAASLGRAYNYAHVSSMYLGMYQAANYDLIPTIRPRVWYLNRAYKTIVAMSYQASWYSHQGLMDGTNFWTILVALQNEGMDEEAAHVEDIMRNRTVVGVTNQCRFYVIDNVVHDLGNDKPGCHWYQVENTTTPWAKQTALPGSGSEFSWDTTGQEEAYIWGNYFNESALSSSALNQILAYTPLVSNFAWHGSAYGMGDFSNNGYIRFNGGNERVLQHYRSGLNAIPSMEGFLRDPTDMYLLRLAAGSVTGTLTNIDQDGAPSMGFHSDQSLLEFDPASGDHGLAFYGHSHITQSVLVDDPDFGLLCYFCDVASSEADVYSVTPRDSYRRTVYIAQLGLQIVSDAGTLALVGYRAEDDGQLSNLTVVFDSVGSQPLSRFRLRLLNRLPGDTRTFKVLGQELTRGGYDLVAPTTGQLSVIVTWDN